MAIRNLVSRSPEHCAAFLDLKVESLLRRAMKAHSGECHDEARAALRDLDCPIELKELWTGTGRDLIHDWEERTLLQHGGCYGNVFPMNFDDIPDVAKGILLRNQFDYIL